MNTESFSIKRPVSMPRSVIGYHGCTQETANKILSETRFIASTNTYDWLGEGIYFWEYAPYRALDWAMALSARTGGDPAVIGVTIRLGRCLNLLDTQHSNGLVDAYNVLETNRSERELPVNLRRVHYLDREVIDLFCSRVTVRTSKPYQTVRGCYPEGDPVFPGSKILSLTHVQIAVRDPACISGAHLVQF